MLDNLNPVAARSTECAARALGLDQSRGPWPHRRGTGIFDWVDESDTSQETLHWLSQTETLDLIAQARAELAVGQGL